MEAKDGHGRHGSRAQSVVVDLLGKLERRPRMALCGPRALGYKDKPGQPLVNHGLQSGTRGRLAKRLAKQRDPVGDVCGSTRYVAEKNERLGARWDFWRPLQEIESERAGSAQVAGRDVRACGCDRAAMTVVPCVQSRQPEGMLAELSGGDGRAPGARQGRSVLKGSGDLRVRALGR
jgi:hypothetical protein